MSSGLSSFRKTPNSAKSETVEPGTRLDCRDKCLAEMEINIPFYCYPDLMPSEKSKTFEQLMFLLNRDFKSNAV